MQLSIDASIRTDKGGTTDFVAPAALLGLQKSARLNLPECLRYKNILVAFRADTAQIAAVRVARLRPGAQREKHCKAEDKDTELSQWHK